MLILEQKRDWKSLKIGENKIKFKESRNIYK